MKAATQRRMTPMLALLALAFAAVLAILLLGVGEGVRWSPPHAPASLPPGGSAAALPPPQPLEQFALVWQKPLFSPDRRPSAVADAQGAVGDLALTGVIITPGLRMVLAHDKSNNRDLQIVEGKSTPDGRWTLVEVHPRAAVFDAPDGRIELKLPAGAPFEKTGPHDMQPGAAEMQRHEGTSLGGDDDDAPEDDPNPPQSPRMGLSPNAGRAQRPRQTQAQLQAERIRQLNAVIQKRRAEQAASNPQGAR
ncbi:hypothetical protein [Dyella sp.]|uniref:hypothetical protein n=1 Tax=Dyella sp. TaxID=1869338 RepID=UPI002D79B52D|nr:hypothetical protein [Dyella sp.]HET6431349.1 hypothetical protein [Dyella sp.]